MPADLLAHCGGVRVGGGGTLLWIAGQLSSVLTGHGWPESSLTHDLAPILQARKDLLSASLPSMLVPNLAGKDVAGAQEPEVIERLLDVAAIEAMER